MSGMITVDPTGHYKNRSVSPERLTEVCGVLIPWAAEAVEDGVGLVSKALEKNYPYFYSWSEESEAWSIDDEGVFKYTGDPRQYPLVKVETDLEVGYIYPYSMVAVVTKATNVQRYSRFD